MSSEETLIQVRREKHQQLNQGKYPLASDPGVLPFTHHDSIRSCMAVMTAMQEAGTLITSIVTGELEMSPGYMLRGRITALRKSGAITFIKLTDSTGSVQIIVSKAAYLDYDSIKLFDLGDIVEVGGRVCLSKTGEKSLLAFGLRLLAKAHRPPPEKFAGVADTELIYRKRYLDLMSSEESRARFTVRSYVLRAIRDFMDSGQFLEVETPTLAAIASGANAKPFETHHNALDIPLRLRIAPELYLKRLLVGGLDRVYEIGRNYRNEGIDTRHNPEFTMMESYQAYGNFPDLIRFTKDLLQHIQTFLDVRLPSPAHSYWMQWKKDMGFSFWQCVEVPMERAVQTALDKVKMRAYLDEPYNGEWYQFTPPEYCPDEVSARLAKIDLMGLLAGLNRSNSRGERLALFFEYLAEPFLVEDYQGMPVFITEYPKAICPLARTNDQNSGVCDRFELFVQGHELANAFQELNDPDEQALRFKEQLEAGGKDPMAYDADYVEALQHGMPPAIGFGMGIDRLVMLLTNTSSIKDVILFPTLRPEQ
jgi:lysyl-tRNA synthetase, class II